MYVYVYMYICILSIPLSLPPVPGWKRMCCFSEASDLDGQDYRKSSMESSPPWLCEANVASM